MLIMKLVFIFGPQAVGKMTVGQKLAEQTGFKLFHNHMTLELLAPIFGFTEDTWRLSDLFRYEIFKSVAANNELTGLIFTYVWAFNEESDWAFVDKICQIFKEENAEVYFVELEADLNERIARNKTPNRLKHKPSKRNVEYSEQELKTSLEKYRLNSYDGEITKEKYIKLNNTNKSSKEVAEIIINTFQL